MAQRNRDSMSSMTNTTTSTDIEGSSSRDSIKSSPGVVVEVLPIVSRSLPLLSSRSVNDDLTQMILDRRQEKTFPTATATIHLSASTSSRHNNVFGKTYHCQRCLNHGIEVPRKGHKRFCKYAACECPNCDLVDQRRKLNKEINSEREKNGSPTGLDKNDFASSKIKTRNPKCARCSVHTTNAEPPPLKGHKNSCPYKNCDCKKCTLVNSRRSIMARQIHLRRTQKAKPGQRHIGEKRELARPLLNRHQIGSLLESRRSAGLPVKPVGSPDILKHEAANDGFGPLHFAQQYLNPVNHGQSLTPAQQHSIYAFLAHLHRHQSQQQSQSPNHPQSPTTSSRSNSFLTGNAALAQRRLPPTFSSLKAAQASLTDCEANLLYMTGSASLGLPLTSTAAFQNLLNAGLNELLLNAIAANNTGQILSNCHAGLHHFCLPFQNNCNNIGGGGGGTFLSDCDALRNILMPSGSGHNGSPMSFLPFLPGLPDGMRI